MYFSSRAFVCLFFACVSFCSFSLPLGVGVAAVCDCGTTWTFLLTFIAQNHQMASAPKIMLHICAA